jgi:hypothetical protein
LSARAVAAARDRGPAGAAQKKMIGAELGLPAGAGALWELHEAEAAASEWLTPDHAGGSTQTQI